MLEGQQGGQVVQLAVEALAVPLGRVGLGLGMAGDAAAAAPHHGGGVAVRGRRRILGHGTEAVKQVRWW